MRLVPNILNMYVVDDPLIEDWFSLVAVQSLKYGKRLTTHEFMFDQVIESFRIKRVPFICNDTMGGYDNKLEWSTGVNDYLPESYFPKWLKTQHSRYAQRKLLDIL